MSIERYYISNRRVDRRVTDANKRLRHLLGQISEKLVDEYAKSDHNSRLSALFYFYLSSE